MTGPCTPPRSACMCMQEHLQNDKAAHKKDLTRLQQQLACELSKRQEAEKSATQARQRSHETLQRADAVQALCDAARREAEETRVSLHAAWVAERALRQGVRAVNKRTAARRVASAAGRSVSCVCSATDSLSPAAAVPACSCFFRLLRRTSGNGHRKSVLSCNNSSSRAG